MPRKVEHLWPQPCAHPAAPLGHATPGIYLVAVVSGDGGDAEVALLWVCRDHAVVRNVACDHTNATPGRPCPWCFFRHD